MALPLTDSQWQALVLVMVNDTDGVVAPIVATLWAKNARWAGVGDLQYLYTLQDAVFAYRAFAKKQVDFAEIGNIDIKRRDQVLTLERMYTDVTAEIALRQQQSSSGGMRMGAITTTAPLVVPPGAIDANDPAYLGSPYWVPPGRVQG